MGPQPRPLLDRFVEFIELADNGCWNWTAFKDKNGYAQITERIGPGKKRTLRAARVSYELFIGDIPSDPALKDTPNEITVDHVCKRMWCCNPNHLRLVTRSQNSIEGGAKIHAVKTHCAKGHPYDEANTKIRPTANGRTGRTCRECQRLDALIRSQKRRGLIPAYAPRLRDFVNHERREAT